MLLFWSQFNPGEWVSKKNVDVYNCTTRGALHWIQMILISFPLFFCRMKKREVFQIPADMSPAETGNPATSYDGSAH